MTAEAAPPCQRSMPLIVREYSRIRADRSAQLILKGIRRVLFGAGAGARPMEAA